MKTLKARILAAQSYQCAYCRCDLTLRRATFDHVVPRSKGGGNVGNRVVVCGTCNQNKADRMPTEREQRILRAIEMGAKFVRVSKAVKRRQAKRRRIWKLSKCWDDGEPC